MDTYTAALNRARKELAQLASERERIDKRIALLRQLIEAMIPFIESENLAAETARLISTREDDSERGVVIVNEGITDAIKRAFTLDHLLTPTEVRDQLEIMGFDLSKHSNPMATIHSVLKRLNEQGWLEQAMKGEKPAYVKKLRTYRDWDEEVMQLAMQLVEPMAKAAAQVREFSQDKAMIDAFNGAGSSPTLTRRQMTEAYKHGLKELKGLTGEVREAKVKEINAELAANRRALKNKE